MLFAAVCACFLCLLQSVNCGTVKELLYNDLTKDYVAAVDPGKISLEIQLNVVCVSVEKSTGWLTANVWEYLSWKDSRLKWLPKEYDGIEILRVPARHIWTPDIKLYNSAEPFAERDYETNAVVQADGTVLWVPRATYRFRCTDLSKCRLRVASWTYDGYNVELKIHGTDGVDLSYYDEACPLKVTDHKADVVSHVYPCCKEPYPSLDVTFTVQPQQ
jgi:hypothetical protein